MAREKGLRAGRGFARCTVAKDGQLADCVPLPAEPEGFGFSEAAVLIVSVLKMNLWTEEGGPVDGVKLRIPVRFSLPAEAGVKP